MPHSPHYDGSRIKHDLFLRFKVSTNDSRIWEAIQKIFTINEELNILLRNRTKIPAYLEQYAAANTHLARANDEALATLFKLEKTLLKPVETQLAEQAYERHVRVVKQNMHMTFASLIMGHHQKNGHLLLRPVFIFSIIASFYDGGIFFSKEDMMAIMHNTLEGATARRHRKHPSCL